MTIKYKKTIIELLSIIIGVVISLQPAPAGLGQNAMVFIGVFVWAIINWIAELMLPLFACIIAFSVMIITGTTTFTVAFSSFSGSTFWLVLAVFLIGNAVSKTGLISRICLQFMRICPPSFRGQCFALLAGGFVLSPFMPSTTAKVGIAGGFSTRIGELLGYKPRSREMSGLWCAMYTGFCLLAPVFTTASIFSYVVLSQLNEAEAEPFTFLGWMSAMLPWGIAMMIIAYMLIMLLYAPKESAKLDKGQIRKLIEDLGPMNRGEKITTMVLILCLVLWCAERTTGISATVVSLLAVSILAYFGVLSKQDFNRIDWHMTFYIGAIIGLSGIIADVGIDEWIGNTYGVYLSSIVANPVLLIIVSCVIMQLLRFVVVSGTTSIALMTVILSPFCRAAGVNTWIVGISVYAMSQVWYMKYQNAVTMVAYGAAGGDEKVDYNATVKFCFLYHLAAVIVLAASVPYWKLFGIL